MPEKLKISNLLINTAVLLKIFFYRDSYFHPFMFCCVLIYFVYQSSAKSFFWILYLFFDFHQIGLAVEKNFFIFEFSIFNESSTKAHQYNRNLIFDINRVINHKFKTFPQSRIYSPVHFILTQFQTFTTHKYKNLTLPPPPLSRGHYASTTFPWYAYKYELVSLRKLN